MPIWHPTLQRGLIYLQLLHPDEVLLISLLHTVAWPLRVDGLLLLGSSLPHACGGTTR
jgi:hypothetical protein